MKNEIKKEYDIYKERTKKFLAEQIFDCDESELTLIQLKMNYVENPGVLGFDESSICEFSIVGEINCGKSKA